MARAPRSLEERFWEKVEKTDECWLWTAGQNAKGYGRIRLGGQGTPFEGSHRVAWRLTNGPIPPGMYICHSCDVRHCVNPEHLFLGTPQDNTQDMLAKGRRPFFQSNVRLSADDVRTIRALRDSGVMLKEIAPRFGIGETHVSRIARRVAWAHLA